MQTQQQKCDAAKERLDWLLKTLHTAQAGVEHLANKLQHISLVLTISTSHNIEIASLSLIPNIKIFFCPRTQSFLSVIPFYVCSLIFFKSEDTVPEVDPDSDHFVLELMAQCEKKLLSLHKELQGKDVAGIMKELEKNKVRQRPSVATRLF